MRIDKETYDKMPDDLKCLFSPAHNYSREEVLGRFPQTTSGTKKAHHVRTTSKSKNVFGDRFAEPEDYPGDSGSAARFFYCAKASKKDRDEGLEGGEYSLMPDTPEETVEQIKRLLTL